MLYNLVVWIKCKLSCILKIVKNSFIKHLYWVDISNLHFKKVRKLKNDKSETKFYFVSNS